MTMSNLLSELDAVMGLADKATPGEWDVFVRRGGMIDVAASHNCTVASLAVPVIGDREANAQLMVRLHNLFRTHRAEIAAAVRDGEALRAFHSYFRDRCETLFHEFGMDAIDLYNKAAMSAREGE